MSPVTHLLASWVVAAKSTDNPRDCRLVALAGVLPDADGLGVILDLAAETFGWQSRLFYARYHHFLLHGLWAGLVLALVLGAFAQRRVRVLLLSLVVFHLHLLCDLVGSRGPAPADLWPIFYLGPLSRTPMWIWKWQWALDAWPNRLISVVLFVWAIWLAGRRGHSVVGVFNRRVDKVFVDVLKKWEPSGERVFWR